MSSRPTREIPSSATVVPPSGTPLPSVPAEKLKTPFALGVWDEKNHVPGVASNPLPDIVPVPEIRRKLPLRKSTVDAAKSKVNPPTLQRPMVGVEGLKI